MTEHSTFPRWDGDGCETFDLYAYARTQDCRDGFCGHPEHADTETNALEQRARDDDTDRPPYCFCGHIESAHQPVSGDDRDAGATVCVDCQSTGSDDYENNADPYHSYEAATDAEGRDL